jgi:hypothetical protein
MLDKIEYLEDLINDIKRENGTVPVLYYLSDIDREYITEEEIDIDIKECEEMLDCIYKHY